MLFEFASHPRKSARPKMHLVFQNAPIHFCTFLKNACGKLRKWAPEPVLGFLGSEIFHLETFEDTGAPCGAGRCVACVCGAVCVCGECHGVSNAC